MTSTYHHILGRTSTRSRIVTVLLAVLVATGVLHAPTATASTAPAFELPFGCFQQVKAATYSGHGGAIDFWKAYDYTSSRGLPVVAAADGVISGFTGDHGRPGGSDIYIWIDHGNGWETRYHHLMAGGVVPGLHVGMRVEQGQMIARVGWTGSISPKTSSRSHLHFEVREHGSQRSLYVDGAQIHPASGGGDNSSSGVYTSGNCPRFPDTFGNAHRPAILRVADANIVSGFSNGFYGPDLAVTRGQLATFVARAAGLGTPGSNAPDFPDIAGNTHRDSIRAAAEAGYISGYADGTFGPEAPVTRAQVSSILAKAFGIPDSGGDLRFDDVSPKSVHAKSIVDLTDADVISGYPDNTFRPNAPVTRAQIATLLARAIG